MTSEYRTSLGRRLVEPVVGPAKPAKDPRPTPDTVFVCRRRFHVSTLPAVLCAECGNEGDKLVLMEKFERAKP